MAEVRLQAGGSIASGAAPEDVRVLIVDDREDNLEVLAGLLDQPGVGLLKASSGPAALELLLEHDVALALVDVRMPSMDGFELAELMRGTERTRRVPIIFVTAATPQSVRVFRGYEAGAVDFLFKPLDPQLVQSKVAVFIELFRQRQQLAAQVEEHKKLVHTAELLIGVLSHDLRAPMSAIVTAGELLARAYPQDERIGNIARRIGSSSRRMTKLIEQLLDFATARLGQLPVKPQATSLNDLCEAAVAEYAQRRANVEYRIAGDPVGTWDPDRLLQLLSNLIGNAVQHGDPDGPVTVRVEGLVDSTIRIEVENKGLIPHELRDTLFSPFVRTGTASSGAGLGLYIVDQIARAHGGEAAMQAVGDRTVFSITLPRHVAR